jgi:hypothetical protein
MAKYGLLGLSLGNFAAAQTTGADAHTPAAARNLGAHWPQVDIPAPPLDVVRVTDIVSKLRTFAADFANLCHDFSR